MFSADNGLTGREPWRSDGTAAGTQLVRAIAPKSLTAVAGTLYFRADAGVAGAELRRGDGIPDAVEQAGCSSDFDLDSDDDGLADGVEAANAHGAAAATETDPCNADTDGDGLADGLELGVAAGLPDPGDGALRGTGASFVPDADAGATTTSPLAADTDGDGIPDGIEDADRDGEVDPVALLLRLR